MIQEIPISHMLKRAAIEGWTQSEITTYNNCHMLWYWRYGMLLRRKGTLSWASIYGTAFHATVEEMYATKGRRWTPAPLIIPSDVHMTADRLREKEYWENVLAIQTECYAQHYADDFTMFQVEHLERDVDINWKGIRLRGKLDLTFLAITSGLLWLMDHKTTKDLTLRQVAGWDFRFQFMFYLWLALQLEPDKPIVGYYINAVKKPTIRQKQGENMASFLARLRGEMNAEPEKYYYREPLMLTRTSMEYFERVILGPKLFGINLLTNDEVSDIIKENLVKDPNTDYCQRYGVPCEFLPLCQHGMELEGFQYEPRSAKHEELEETSAE